MQFGCGAHRRLLPAVRRPAGAGGRELHPRPAAAGEEDEAAEEEHAAGEGLTSARTHIKYALKLKMNRGLVVGILSLVKPENTYKMYKV